MARIPTRSLPSNPRPAPSALRRGQRLGKYKILEKLGEGGFARVYSALDTLEGVRVALKIPYEHLITHESLDRFYREVRLAARLEHPNILALKNADFIGDRFVAVTARGDETLAERLKRRLATATALDFAEQALAAAAFAHGEGIIHCDIKPDNLILFGDVVRLTDFGIAKVANQTVHASGSGTLGFVAPEQAMGKPSLRSDVFSLGLVIYRMLSGELPEWPYEWPLSGHRRLRRKVSPAMVQVLAKSLEVNPRRRFADADSMLRAFRAARRNERPKTRTATPKRPRSGAETRWRAVRRREFQRRFGRALASRHPCHRCGGPVSEAMAWCPWCGVERKRHEGGTDFPAVCPRCNRGVKLDWRFCPWCWGEGFEPAGSKQYTDRRYAGRCDNPRCSRKDLMPFMRYCPWCHRKVRKAWKIPGETSACPSCRWPVAGDYWSHCAWCGKAAGT